MRQTSNLEIGGSSPAGKRAVVLKLKPTKPFKHNQK
jgi:hypothetical protein